jgi:hypothetical protein
LLIFLSANVTNIRIPGIALFIFWYYLLWILSDSIVFSKPLEYFDVAWSTGHSGLRTFVYILISISARSWVICNKLRDVVSSKFIVILVRVVIAIIYNRKHSIFKVETRHFPRPSQVLDFVYMLVTEAYHIFLWSLQLLQAGKIAFIPTVNILGHRVFNFLVKSVWFTICGL